MTGSRTLLDRARSGDHATAPELELPAPTLVSWGELLWDLFPDGPRLGGAAANLAYHAARLGCRTLLVSRVGDDELGRAAMRALAAAGVTTDFVQVDPDAPTGTVRVDVSAGEPRFSIEQHAAWDAIQYGPELGAVLRGADVFCFSTLAQRRSLGSRALHEALAATGPECVRICDLNLRAPFFELRTVLGSIDRAHVVKLNETEADFVGRHTGGEDVTRWLLARGVELVALTRGARGACLATSTARYDHPGVAASGGGDSVGAGDAFVAALGFHLARSSDLALALDRACRLAAHVASCSGAMPPLPETLLHEVRSVLTGTRDP